MTDEQREIMKKAFRDLCDWYNRHVHCTDNGPIKPPKSLEPNDAKRKVA